jgi:tetratricopeptide (TPR) repeat protein
MGMLRLALAAFVAVAFLSSAGLSPRAAPPPRPELQRASLTALLDRYLQGEFASVVTHLEAVTDFGDLLNELERDGPGWIEAGSPGARSRRELAAATFALEAARVDARVEWKQHIEVPDPHQGTLLYWQPPPRLIEWACARFRQQTTPTETERLWQLAALSVAQRAGDFEFLVSDGTRTQPVNFVAEFAHLHHTRKRFPDEPRMQLAEGIAVEWQTVPGVARGGPQMAKALFEALLRDQDVGAEASVRLGYTHVRLKDDDRGIELFTRAEAMTRDPWVLYLARYLRGAALDRKKRTGDAERAYRGALAAVPQAQSASVALAALLFTTGRRAEGSALTAGMLSANPRPVDPWRGYAYADDRFWPELIARLRAEIRR